VRHVAIVSGLAFALANGMVGTALATPYSFLPIEVPGAQAGRTTALGINNAGQVTGRYYDLLNNARSFVDTGGSFITFDVPQAFANSTYAQSINKSGRVAGFYQDAAGDHGFVKTADSFTTLDAPGATGGTLAMGIDAAGQVTGYHYDGTGSHGFVDTAHRFTTLDMPGMPVGQTTLWGISDAGQVAGYYGDSTFSYSFVATQAPTDVPEPASAVLMALSLAAALVARSHRWPLRSYERAKAGGQRVGRGGVTV